MAKTQNITDGESTFESVEAGDTFYIGAGTQTITGNVDGSASNTSVLAEIARSFSGSIGSETAPWVTAFSTRLVYMAKNGHMWFRCASGDSSTTPIVWHLGGGHFHGVTGGTYTRYEAISGQTTIANGVTVTTGRFNGAAEGLIEDTGSGAAMTLLELLGKAVVRSERPHTTASVYGGQLTIDSDQAGGTNATGTLNVYGGHVILLDPGTITALNWYGGTIDASKLFRPLTITNSTINMTLPSAQALLDHTLVDINNKDTGGGSNATTMLFSDGRALAA